MTEGYFVYKVVAAIERNKVGYLSSCYAPFELRVNYEIGVKAIPKVGKLFCFDNLNNARHFVKYMSRVTEVFIILCETNSLVSSIEVDRIPIGTTENRSSQTYTNFWKSPSIWRESNCGEEIPKGTVFCDYVIPLEVVQ